MDDRVKELLERVRGTAVAVGEAAGVTARCAGKCAGQMLDTAKLNMKIFDLKGDIDRDLQAIGRMVYDAHRGQETDHAAMDGLLAGIDEKSAAIETLRGRVAVLRHSRTCPSCGMVCGQEDKFCRGCGASL
ncbi:zinc ribbon domain-containing protein [Intestinimonas massiliensis (ex Afouda et al. 2020)]|uniref:zinc ribbon domain-containing protein n=1 Tax=Intestinimonas massiliensis (ex Afouda et al. 2020) TaxID=1673721 RepID=UPI001031407F|nr:zinc ribbon domain-containing protein [Intestinimonas massiliensis (ex Afouda et al. 2020)]